ncbi:hypothetical protein [uncultured Gimesia sp.]|tara:strand:+ start:214183 stop:214308 length:126 start_codon:yes stop_codon:yes gene_type:complete
MKGAKGIEFPFIPTKMALRIHASLDESRSRVVPAMLVVALG